jgi:ethanolamine transporter
MLFKTILMAVISVFFAAGALDYIIGGKFGLKTEFENAFSMIGKIMLNIVGMICLAPTLAQLLRPLIVPVYSLFGIDAAMFAPTFLAPDAGGYSIAVAMASDAAIGAWAGTVVASHIGAAFSFNIPVTLGVIDKSHYRIFSLGALSGLIACPFGCILGGLISGLPLSVILINMIPAILLALIVILGLIFKQDACMRVFLVFVKLLRVIIVIGLTAAAIERLTGFVIIPGMNPISTGFLTAGTIGLTLAGILVMTKILSVLLKKPLARLSRLLKINELSLLMCINALCVVLPGAVVYDKMDKRGKLIFGAITVSAANIIGAHLSYIGLNAPEMLPAATAGKLLSGLLGVIIALLFYKRSEKAGEI